MLLPDRLVKVLVLAKAFKNYFISQCSFNVRQARSAEIAELHVLLVLPNSWLQFMASFRFSPTLLLSHTCCNISHDRSQFENGGLACREEISKKQ